MIHLARNRPKGILFFLWVACLSLSSGGAVAVDRTWMMDIDVDVERMTQALNEAWILPAKDARKEAETLQGAIGTISGRDRPAPWLMLGVLWERAGEEVGAYTAYKTIEAGLQNSYYVSAALRLRAILEQPYSAEETETFYLALAKEQGDVWILKSDKWVLTSMRNTAMQELVGLRSDRLSFRFFQFFRQRSPFSKEYSYLFIILALTFGIRILALPLQIRGANVSIKVRQLLPEVEVIKAIHQNNPAEIQRNVMLLYKQRGVNLLHGCAVAVVDLVFVVWAIFTLGKFSPQLVLDGSMFIWISDVTRFDHFIIALWLATSIVANWINVQYSGQSQGQMTFGLIVFTAVIWSLAWYFGWPAYLFIFWTLLSVQATVLNRIIIQILLAVRK